MILLLMAIVCVMCININTMCNVSNANINDTINISNIIIINTIPIYY